MQDQANNVVQLPVSSSKIQNTLSNFEASSDPVKLEVLQQKDGTMKIGSKSQAYPASSSEVVFFLNSLLKKAIELEKLSRITNHHKGSKKDHLSHEQRKVQGKPKNQLGS